MKTIWLSVALYCMLVAGDTDNSIKLYTENQEILVEYNALDKEELIGCAYIGNTFLTRLTPEDIEEGNAAVKVTQFIEIIQQSDTPSEFIITTFIEGISNGKIIRQEQSSRYQYTVAGSDVYFSCIGDGAIDAKLRNFVYGKFTELRRIREKIKKEKALWTADVNPIFMMPDEEFAKTLGLKVHSSETYNNEISPSGSRLIFPPELDWCDMNGENWMTPVKNQNIPRDAGTCWAFAALGQVEALININQQDPNFDIDLAEQTLVSDYGRWCGDCDGGMTFYALHYIRNYGIPTESADPYMAHNCPGDMRPSTLWRIQSYTRVTWQSKDENIIKDALEHCPLSTSVYVDDDFKAYIDGVFSYSGTSHVPNHAIVFVGWNDNDFGGTQTWKIKNSWGEGWGEDGYMRLIRGQNNNCGWYTYTAD